MIRPGIALVALVLAGCATLQGPPTAEAPARGERTLAAARGLAYTETFEIRFDGELVGYLVDVKATPEGIPDARAFKPDSALIQGPDLEFLGFITPSGTSYRFDEDGKAHFVAWGTRKAAIARFFHQLGLPKLAPVGTGG